MNALSPPGLSFYQANRGETLKFERSPSTNSKRSREVANRSDASHIPHRDPQSFSELSIFTIVLPKRPNSLP